MFCGHCGKTIADGLKFCPECGKAQTAAVAEDTSSTPTPSPKILKPGECPSCGYQNNPNRATCKQCRTQLRATNKPTSHAARNGCIGGLALLAVGIIAIGALGGSGARPASTPATSAPAVAKVEPTAKPQPTSVPAKPTAPPKPTAVPSMPTPEPVKTTVEFTGAFNPRTLRVGGRLNFELTLKNLSDHTITGIRIFSNGPWDKYTVISVTGNGKVDRGILSIGWNIRTGVEVPQNEERTITIVASPNEPGNHEFSFTPNESDTKFVYNTAGEQISVGGVVNVTR